MKKSVKVTSLIVLAVACAYGMMMFSGCSSSSSSAVAVPATYKGTLYQASESGGHIAVFPVKIDPTKAEPIVVDVANISKIQVAGGPADATNKIIFHDVRFDNDANPTRIYYAAIMSKPANTSVAPLGYVDLTAANTAATNNGINSTIDIDAAAADTVAFALGSMALNEFSTSTRVLYCGSGMDKTNGYFLPMSMSFPAYIDAIPLTAIETAGSHVTSATANFQRTYIDQIDADAAGWARIGGSGGTDLGTPPLAFIHGGSSPDGLQVYLSTNVVSGLSPTNNLAGYLRAYLIDAVDLETASSTTVGLSSFDPTKVRSKATYTVAPSNSLTSSDGTLQGTIAYRASFTPNGKYILQSGSDRVLVINANDLSLSYDTIAITGPSTTLGAGTFGGVEVHDVISTPDSKYAILSLRYYVDETQAGLGGAGHPGLKTSGVQLYDIAKKKFLGNVVSTCGADNGSCHVATADFSSRPTCGILFKK